MTGEAKPDPAVVEKLLAQFHDEMELEARLHAIDAQRAALSRELREARNRGDQARCDEIKSQKAALLAARNKLV